MKNPSESISLSNQLDSLLVEILKDAKTYVEKKQDFSAMWSDGMFDLITGNTIKGKGFADRFTEDVEFSALYKLRGEGDDCVIERVEEDKPNATQPAKHEFSEREGEVRKRKGETQEAEGWVESAAEESLEEKVERMKADPLYVLNPMPTRNQRKAQKTLQNSLKLLEDVARRQRSLERKILQFCELRRQKEGN